MSLPPAYIALLLVVLAIACPALCVAQEQGSGSKVVDDLSKGKSGLTNQKIEQKSWNSGKDSNLMQKAFPFKQWDRHYSSVGTKRAPVSVDEAKDKEFFSADTKEFDVKGVELAQWNQKLSNLQKEALIDTDDKAGKLAEKQLYNKMLQDNRKYADMAEELSLRDLNKYQFRRNRSDAAVPVSPAGETK